MPQKFVNAAQYEQRQILSIVRVRGKSIADLFLEYDEENIQGLSTSYINHISQAIQRNGGYLYQKLDHDIIAIFASDLHADKHPLKAIKTAQEIFSDTKIARKFEIKICIDTGECLTTRDTHNTIQAIVGEPLLFSSLLIEDIHSGALAVTKQTMNYLGAHSLVEMDHRIFQYEQRKKFVVYIDPSSKGRLTPFPEMPFIGRRSELNFLSEGERRARTTLQPEYIYMSGSGGIGKTRIIKKFIATQVEHRFILQFSFLPNSHSQNDFIRNIFHQILTLIGLRDISPSANLTSYLTHYFSIKDSTHLLALAELVLGENNDSHWQELEIRARQFIRASLITGLVQKISQNAPTLLVFEDTHWADQDFFILMDFLTTIRASSLLVLLTSRNERDENIDYSIVKPLPINGWQIDDLISALHIALGEIAYQEELSQLLHTKFSGNPLYAHEIFRMISLRDLKNKSHLPSVLNNVNAPFTLQSIIEHQMHTLDVDCKNILRLLSALGPKPRKDLFESCFGEEITDYRDCLNKLEKSGFITLINQGFDDSYAFSHELVQQAVYQTLTSSQKKDLHQRIYKQAAASEFENKNERLKLLAYHTYLGEIWRSAYKYNYLLGCRCDANFDPKNARKYFSACLDCNQRHDHNDTSHARRKISLNLNIAKNIFMMADFSDMKDIMNTIDDSIHQTRVPLHVLHQYTHLKSAYNWIIGDYITVILDTKSQLQDQNAPTADHFSYLIKLGSVYSDIGKYQLSNEYYAQAIQEFTHQPKTNQSSIPTTFPALGICYSMMARNFAFLGQSEHALNQINNAMQFAHSQKNPSSIIFILCFCAEAFLHNKMYKNALPLVEKAHVLSGTYGIDILFSYIKSLLGYVRAATSQSADVSLNLGAIKLALKERRKCRLSMHYYYLGKTYNHQNNQKLARKQFLEAWHLARVYGEQGYELIILRELILLMGPSLRRDILLSRVKALTKKLILSPENQAEIALASS